MGFEDGFISQKKLLEKYNPEDINYISANKTVFYLLLFLAPALLILFFIFFQLQGV